jgi:hypothetical protein
MRPPTSHAVRRRASRRVRSALTRADAVRLVVVPALTAGIVYALCIAPARHPAADGGLGRVALVQKDASWRPLPVHPGAPAGGVWYSTRGASFRFGFRAVGLQPTVHYIIELNVDDAPFEVADRSATGRGEVVLDTTLSTFADGACAGSHRQAVRSLVGTHRVKFLLKRNGNPPDGGPTPAAAGIDERAAPWTCAGNGDSNFSYVLFEEKLAIYDGDR